MADREKVIKGLTACMDGSCKECPYNAACTQHFFSVLASDALELLKEQEAVEPYMDYDGHDVWRCGKCGATIFHIFQNESDEDWKSYAKFCRHCGLKVKWE